MDAHQHAFREDSIDIYWLIVHIVGKMQANVVEIDNSDEEEVVLFSGSLKNEIRQLGHEATN